MQNKSASDTNVTHKLPPADTAFQAIMSDLEKHYKVSDRLYDILSDSLGKHLAQALATQQRELLDNLENKKLLVDNLLEMTQRLFEHRNQISDSTQEVMEHSIVGSIACIKEWINELSQRRELGEREK